MRQRTGFTCSAFDLLHAGHILMLEEAKSVCNYLIVGLQINPSIDRPLKRKPIQTLEERRIQLQAVRFVDRIVTYTTEDDLLYILRELPIHVRIIGEEYKDKDFTGKALCEERNIDIYYNSRKHDYSTTSLVERIKNSNSRIKG